ncbi:MAG: serine/threonine-protein phosphatase [Desulfobacteraceae bacterium]|nr:MAG: serine/threonine-protein phosphatase [Desulfobacteraceae bacterium]
MQRMDDAGSNKGMTGRLESQRLFFIDHGARSHIGYGRLSNEDAVWHTPKRFYGCGHGFVWAVADGIGGNGNGDVASRLACEQLGDYHALAGCSAKPVAVMKLRRRIEQTILRADRHIRRIALLDPRLVHMGTTLSCLVLTAGQSIIGHVGDSRIYRLRRNHLSCLTRDHTFVQEMIFEGELDPRKARTHPLRNMLTLAVGTEEPLAYVATRIDRLHPDDRFLLCTDGLHNAVGYGRIAARLSQTSAAADIAAALVDDALYQGALDNVTALVVKLNGDGSRGRPQNEPTAFSGDKP